MQDNNANCYAEHYCRPSFKMSYMTLLSNVMQDVMHVLITKCCADCHANSKDCVFEAFELFGANKKIILPLGVKCVFNGFNKVNYSNHHPNIVQLLSA
jgi:hypothetical protein